MRRRILVVDDEPGMVRAVQRVLSGKHDVIGTTDPNEALRVAGQWQPDLAVLDVRLPGTDGFELMARLRQVCSGVDVILMTGSVGETDQKLIRAVRQRAFYFIHKPFDRELLHVLVDRCLELRRLAEENRRHLARLESEVDQARQFQRSLLPPEEAELGGVHVRACNRPCAELGGDLYDYAACADGGAAFLVADVSGHGASAAMLTGVVKAAFQAARTADYAPAAVARAIADGLRGFAAHRYVTVFAGRLDAGAEQLTYVNGGHPPGLLWRAGDDDEVVRLAATGRLVSSVFPETTWSEARVRFGSGAALLICTDGATEAWNEGGEIGLVGVEAAASLARKAGEPLLPAVLAAVAAHSEGRRLLDDLTLLSVTRHPEAAAIRSPR